MLRNEPFVMYVANYFSTVPLASTFIYDAFYCTEILNFYVVKSVSHFLYGFWVSCFAYKGIPVLKTI